ncbi:hypothetical protein ACI7RC_27085 [Brevibacillus sp. B_LB10_24]|uniref:hypothetical protein n=1 Tax=Brevibacillus sp. B_LB10_24 TaxID=3380645 RepID=UPI0038B9BB42
MRTKNLLVACICMMLVCLYPVQGLTAIAESEVKTPPPPREVFPNTAFDPKFRYLESGEGNISDFGGGKITIGGQTHATKYVDNIGIKITLQKWNGSTWEDYNVGKDLTQSNELDIYTSRQITVPTGYYYRVHSVHWVVHNGIREQGERFTSSSLMK